MGSESVFTKCKACGKYVSATSKTCTQCGAELKKLSVIHWIGIVALGLIIIILLNSPDEDSTTNSAPSSKPVKEWVYAVPLKSISTVNVWEKAGEKNIGNNQVVKSLDTSTKIGIVERTELPSGAIYYYAELEDGTRGYIARPFVAKDIYGYQFYEENPATGEKLRDGMGYSFSSGNNCILHVAALGGGDLKKGEYESTEEFKKRYESLSLTIPWFNNDITYAYIYEIKGEYNADNQVFSYESYRLYERDGYLRFDDDCTDTLGYELMTFEKNNRTRYGKAETILNVEGASIPKKFSKEKYVTRMEVEKRVERSSAPAFKNALLLVGIKPTKIAYVSKGNNGYGKWEPKNHITNLNGNLSYAFLLTNDGSHVIESYFDNYYEQTWQRDLQSQLVIAGYDVGAIDGFAGDSTKRALESAAADGVLPNAEMSMRSTMVLINHNRSK